MTDGTLETVPGQPDHHAARLLQRTASSAATFLLPHLSPGMRVLDCGCGPGSITLGLAEAVAPGEVVGVDPDPRRIAGARRSAAESSLTNVRFEEAGIHTLPFADASFDAALVHAVMEHITEPVAALAEVRRVLKPGGVIGVRTAEHCAALIYPADAPHAEFMGLYRRQKAAVGQDADIGRKLRSVLQAAGFSGTEGSATVEVAGTPEQMESLRHNLTGMLTGAPIVADMMARGWIDQSDIDRLTDEYSAWAKNPEAYLAITWCAALGWNN